jgi:hypothetical protein
MENLGLPKVNPYCSFKTLFDVIAWKYDHFGFTSLDTRFALPSYNKISMLRGMIR